MGVNYNGLPEIQQRLRELASEKQIKKITDDALKAGAKVIAVEISKRLIANLGEYSTGATVEEIVIGRPKSKRGSRTIRIGWNGPSQRYRLVHLNENGYTRDGKFYGPQLGGYKQVSKAIEAKKQEYVDTLKAEMRKHL